MKLIIDIPDKAYGLLKYFEKAMGLADKKEDENDNVKTAWIRAVVNGTQLLKGHRFIDADEILNHAYITEDEEGDIFVQKYYCIKKEIVDNALVLFDTLEDKEQ